MRRDDHRSFGIAFDSDPPPGSIKGYQGAAGTIDDPIPGFERQPGEPGSPNWSKNSDPSEARRLEAAVAAMRRDRDRREQFLPVQLFADPAWDMLLELYHAELRHYKVTVSNLCLASRVPPTTALRWIKTLEDAGLVTRRDDHLDGRRIYLSLSNAGSQSVGRYFAACIANPVNAG